MFLRIFAHTDLTKQHTSIKFLLDFTLFRFILNTSVLSFALENV